MVVMFVRKCFNIDLYIADNSCEHLCRVLGLDNPSDLMTKYKSKPEILRFLEMLRLRPRSGRSALAPARVLVDALSRAHVHECTLPDLLHLLLLHRLLCYGARLGGNILL